MPIYLKLDGITGDCTQADHKQWMDIDSMTWNVTRSIQTQAGATTNRESSEPQVGEVTLIKRSDSSTAKLIQESTTGKTGKTATIDMVTTGNPGQTYLQYTLTNTLVSSYASTTTGDRPVETITLNFTKKEVKYTSYDEQNNPQSPQIASYNISTAQAS